MYQTLNTTRIAKFGSGGAILRAKHEPLTDDAIMAAVPSIYAQEAHSSRSAKFQYIPTIDVLNGLRAEGFMPFEVRQGGSRDMEKRGFTKHMIRLRHIGVGAVGDSQRELILVNAHDGTSSYRLMSGVFRMVCSNGLVAAIGDMQELRVPHKGNIIGEVIEGAYRVIADGARVDANIASMRALELTQDEQRAFAAAALEFRFGEDKESPISADTALKARREADVGADLWRTFNRVQENLVQGGQRYVQRDAQGYVVANRRTQPVNSIDGNVKLNRALWTLANKMQELKAA